MAKSPKTTASQTKPDDDQVTPVDADTVPDLGNETSSEENPAQDDVPVEMTEPDNGREDLSDDPHGDDTSVEFDQSDESAPPEPEETEIEETELEETEPAPDHTPQTAQSDAPPPARSGMAGFVVLLLGGVAAGAIGYGVGQYDPSGKTAFDAEGMIAEQAARIGQLEDQVASVDPAPAAQRIDEIEARLTSLADQVQTGVSDIETRLADVERRPNVDGTLPDAALSGYREEFEAVRAELDAQRQEVTALAAQAQADLEAARAESATLEQQAIATAQAAAARAAINRIAAAAETGAPFADVLADPSLDGLEIPAALAEASEEGVPTTAALATAFPDAARAALAAARSEGQSDDAGGVVGFFRTQLDVRSTTPQEGPGPDAVLSRAEAAIKNGRIPDALSEIEALPEVARAAMADWTAQAQSRFDVLAAIARLSETLNSN